MATSIGPLNGKVVSLTRGRAMNQCDRTQLWVQFRKASPVSKSKVLCCLPSQLQTVKCLEVEFERFSLLLAPLSSEDISVLWKSLFKYYLLIPPFTYSKTRVRASHSFMDSKDLKATCFLLVFIKINTNIKKYFSFEVLTICQSYSYTLCLGLNS